MSLAYSEIKKNTAAAVFTVIFIIIMLIVFIISWYKLSMYNGRIDLNARDYKNALLMYVDAILGFFIFAILSWPFSKIPLIKNIFGIFGENSLYILAGHVPSAFVTNVFLIPHLPVIVGTTLAHNSIFSITVLTSLGLLFSLIIALIHKSIHFTA